MLKIDLTSINLIKSRKIKNHLRSNNMTDNTDNVNKLECPESKTVELVLKDYEKIQELLKNDEKLVPQFWINKYKNEASRNWYYYCFKKNIYMYIYIKCFSLQI